MAIRNGAGQYMSSSGTFTSTSVSYRTAFLNSPGSPGSNFSYTTPDDPGRAVHGARAGEDQHGFVTPVPSQRIVSRDGHDRPTCRRSPTSPYSCVQNVCTFDGRTSTDENAPTLTYSWNFGSGSGSGPVPTRTYTSARHLHRHADGA